VEDDDDDDDEDEDEDEDDEELESTMSTIPMVAATRAVA
jgi:hypothetical protein